MKRIQEVVNRINDKYQDNDDMLGKLILTRANGINSPRALILTSQLDQTKVLKYPDIPRMLTRYENAVGDNSSAYKKSDTNWIVVDRIEKFSDYPGHLYTLVVYDPKRKLYDVIHKQYCEKLTESYGYLYNTDVMDSKDVGNTIHKDEVLYRSTSFDKNMNWRYGINAKTMYLIDSRTTEDALVVSESFAKRLASVELESVDMSLNDNDIMLNIYGDSEYKCFPDIGEAVKNKILVATKRIDYSEALFELKYEKLKNVNFTSDNIYFIPGNNTKVIDIEVYSNKPLEEIPDTPYNRQIKRYLEMSLDYHNRIVDVLGKIKETGAKCGDTFNSQLKRSMDILDPTVKWRDGDKGFSIFNNIKISFLVEREDLVYKGSKLAGRYGDKGVVSMVVPDEEMPFTETGERVEVIANILGVPNRENISQIFEVEINFLSDCVARLMKEQDTLDDKVKILLKYLSIISPIQYEDLKNVIKTISVEELEEFINSNIEQGIRVHQPPLFGNSGIEQIAEVYDTFGFKPLKAYVHMFGRDIQLLNRMVVSDKYVIKLKHTSKSKFSARSTGFLNTKELPIKSSVSKNNRSTHSDTANKLGDMETNNIGICRRMDVLADMNMVHFSSIEGRKSTAQLFTNNPIDEDDDITIPETATNRNVEINNALFKCIGLQLDLVELDEVDEE